MRSFSTLVASVLAAGVVATVTVSASAATPGIVRDHAAPGTYTFTHRAPSPTSTPTRVPGRTVTTHPGIPVGPVAPAGVTWRSGVFPGGGIDAAAAQRFASYRGRAVDVAVVYPARSSWSDIATSTWGVDQYKGWAGQLSIGLALLPDKHGGTLAQVASGAHDGDFRSFADNLVAQGRAASVVRLGWEFNGSWFAWSAYDAPSFKAAFRRVVGVLRGEDPQVTIEWCGNAMDTKVGHDPFTQLYPGDDVVDIVAVDDYDDAWAHISDAASFRAWAGRRYSLNDWYAFAQRHGKPFAVSEWGLSVTGQGDNPTYIQGMHDWFDAHASGLAYESYFDEPAKYIAAALDDSTSHLPRSSALYAALWGGVRP